MADTATKYIGLYAKALSAAAVAGFGAYATALQDGPGVTGAEGIGIVIAVLLSLGAVWAVPNVPSVVAGYGKALAGALIAGLTVVGTGWLDGSVSQVEIVNAIIAFIVGLGLVAGVSNAAESDPTDAKGSLIPVTQGEKQAYVNESSYAPVGDVEKGEQEAVVLVDPRD